MGRGDLTVPVVEGWTALAMAAGATSRHRGRVVRAQRHEPAPGGRGADGLDPPDRERRPARSSASASAGIRREHEAYGIDFPPAPERVARLEEAVAVIRALWTGGPVTRDSPFYPLREAHAWPVPDPAPPIVIGGETPAGARLAGRIGDGWTAFEDNFEANLPLYLEALAAAGQAARGPAGLRRVPGGVARATRR